MLKRWILKPSETAPPSPILPDPRNVSTQEKAKNTVYANTEVVKSLTPKRKRGDYNTYGSKQRAKIARYAMEHGVAKAARHFTGKIGKNVNESTVRSLKPYIEHVTESLPLSRRHQRALCIFEVFAAHRTQSFLDKLEEINAKVRFVPASCTGELQPLDLSGNGEFKMNVNNSFIQWYSDQVSKAMQEGKEIKDIDVDLRLSAIKPVHASRIVKAFQEMKNDTIIRWEKAGIKNVLVCKD